ncbi:MAG: hypothetical protein PVF47_16465 [Anaerolineae bacterium]
MQGQLRGESLSCVVRTGCAHSARPLTLEIDSALACRVVEPGAAPVLSIPMVDVGKLDDPSIIDAF